jgi:hypothetical protein
LPCRVVLGSEVTADLDKINFDEPKSNHRAFGLSTRNLSLSQVGPANCQDAFSGGSQPQAQ